jgi:hypothetical protein
MERRCYCVKPRAVSPWIAEDKIVTIYKQAKNRRAQVSILAQLNDVPRSVIVNILSKYGIEPPPRKWGIERTEKAMGKWTLEEDQYITEGYREGMSNAEMAREIGRTNLAVKARLSVIGVCEKGRRRRAYAGKDTSGKPTVVGKV